MKTSLYLTLMFFTLWMQVSCTSKTTYQQLITGGKTIVTSDSIRLKVKIAGKGVPCLFIHGGPGGGYLSFEKMGGSSLEKCLTMIYLDQRGSGSSQNAKNYSLDRVTKDIEEVRQKLGIDKFYLLSHSFGGIIAANYARKYPDHVAGLILANSTLHFLNTATTKAQVVYGYKLLGIDTALQTNNADSLTNAMMQVRQKMSKKHFGYKFLTDDVNTIVKMDSLDEAFPRTNDYGMAVIMPYLDKTKKNLYPEYADDLASLSAQIKQPVLVIAGKKDYAIGVDHYKTFKFPHQKVVTINGGHLLYYENNKEFTNAVCGFIK
jgi:proline iminopeptidase